MQVGMGGRGESRCLLMEYRPNQQIPASSSTGRRTEPAAGPPLPLLAIQDRLPFVPPTFWPCRDSPVMVVFYSIGATHLLALGICVD
jgi:hypothetical protein